MVFVLNIQFMHDFNISYIIGNSMKGIGYPKSSIFPIMLYYA